LTASGEGAGDELDRDALGLLEEMVGGDRAALVEIVDAFLEDAPAQLADLRRAAEGGDDVLAGRAAHTLKANGRTFGATMLASVSQEIEVAARSGDLSMLETRLEELEGLWPNVRAQLTALRDERPA
jgi:HPt (histidine-containing phosphotransfer) domain-containing protein